MSAEDNSRTNDAAHQALAVVVSHYATKPTLASQNEQYAIGKLMVTSKGSKDSLEKLAGRMRWSERASRVIAAHAGRMDVDAIDAAIATGASAKSIQAAFGYAIACGYAFGTTEEKCGSVIIRLIDAGADPAALDPDQVRNLLFCNSVPTIQTVIARGLDVDSYDATSHGRTPLIYAAQNGMEEFARKLLALGADIDAVGGTTMTPLIHAIWHHRVSMVRLLIEAGAGVNARDLTGKTPLMRAAAFLVFGPNVIVELLLAAGARVNERDSKGATALDIAISSGNRECAALLTFSGGVRSTPRR